MAKSRLASRGVIGLLFAATSCVSFSSAPDGPANSIDGGAASGDGGAASRDGGPEDGSAVTDGDAARQKIVFILTAKVAGALATTADAALRKADALCEQEFAQASGRQGSFVAWLGTKAHPVLVRFGTSRGPWYLPSGERVTRGLDDLVMKGPEVPIFVTASSTRLAPDAVWTGSREDGSWAAEDCREWTSAKFDDFGWYGDARLDAGGQWSSVDKRKCDMPSHLYCFEL